MNRSAIVKAMSAKYVAQEKSRREGVVKESSRPVIVRVSPARIQAFALIRTVADADMPADMKPIPRVIRECRVWDTSLDFRNADELLELFDWCGRVLEMPGSVYTMLRETLQSMQTSIQAGLPEVPDDLEPSVHQFGNYTLNVSGLGVIAKDGKGKKVQEFPTMKEALAWVSAKIAESAA